MKSLDRRLNELEKCVFASRLQVIVVRRGETKVQARNRMGSPAFIVIVPEKDSPELAQGDQP